MAHRHRRAVLACVDQDVRERPPADGVRYNAHVDPSGGSNDSFALAIAHREGDRAVLDLVREVRPPFSPESVVADFARDLQRYRIKRVTGDRYAGEWPREQFRKRGIKYELASKSASQLFQESLPLINSGAARLLDDKRLVEQLVNLERRTSFGFGRDNIGHPPGAHDDVAVAVAGALLSATARKQELRVGFYGGTVRPRQRRSEIYTDQDGKTRIRFYEPEPSISHGTKGCY